MPNISTATETQNSSDRRSFVVHSAAAMAGGLFAARNALGQSPADQPSVATQPSGIPKFRFCLNTSTINGGQIPVRQQLQIAADAGYDAVELWLRDVQKYTEQGNRLSDLAKEMRNLGLGLDSAIAFGNWLAEDAQERRAGLEQCRRDMDVVRELGGRLIAAPPVGATKPPRLELNAAAERYRELLAVGRLAEVTPQLELWGFSHNISTLAEVLYVAAAANDADACVLLDVYHMYKGGSDFSNIGLVPGAKMHCLHMNDYPAEPPRDEIADKDRVYPGDGVAPLTHILSSLVAGGFSGTLSLELFNRQYWEQPPELVAKTGLEKMQLAVQKIAA